MPSEFADAPTAADKSRIIHYMLLAPSAIWRGPRAIERDSRSADYAAGQRKNVKLVIVVLATLAALAVMSTLVQLIQTILPFLIVGAGFTPAIAGR